MHSDFNILRGNGNPHFSIIESDSVSISVSNEVVGIFSLESEGNINKFKSGKARS